MDPLLNTKLRHIYIEGSIKDTDYFGLANDWAIALSQVSDEQAQEQMCGLLLCELSGVLLTVFTVSKGHQKLSNKCVTYMLHC